MAPSLSVSLLRSAAEHLVFKRRRAKALITVRSVRAGGYTWSYLEKASPSHAAIVVFIHGFSSEKDAWLPTVERLTESARILVPDLPGHGATTPVTADDDFGVQAQMRNLLTFLDKTCGPDAPIHLVGHSMGGLIAGVFAATFPSMVLSLTLVCPAGISMPTRSPVLAMLEDTGVNLMQATTVDDMQQLMRFADGHHKGEKPATRSRFLLRFYAKHQADRIDVVTKILADMLPERRTLEDHLPIIEAETLVLWGSDDQILDVSCVDRIRLTGMESVVVAGCGHTIIKRRPELVAAYVDRNVKRTERCRVDHDMSSVLTGSACIDEYF
ncbi:Aste57867_502 [Aphanomyces stellatus]|uniref:Aste57867_502 protein n=1 Tax=Aphanomyces stellatus TaxID=120398 RepID=A0A485K3Z5_9STRA|nr:hypothetical protein As57867_000501 [Aphanomyces stellatus]VFT77727.1 Aste57867_502 [Aphanomyces stellatus]